MNIADKIEILTQLRLDIQRYEKSMADLCIVFPQAHNSELAYSSDMLSDGYINTVAKLLNIVPDDLFWFVYDNDFGNRRLKFNGKKITSITSFIKEVS